MPFFWSNSNNSNDRNRLESKMCVAKETPEPIFDLSDCNLSEVPSGVYSMCRVFRKEVLALHNNRLTNISGGGNLQDLSSLKVLNLQDNKLRKLPESMKHMRCLQILNLRGNKFNDFPVVLCKLPKLHTLDIRDNHKLTELSKELSDITTLTTIELDVENIQYPPSEICKKGTESIMKFLCTENGKEYNAPLPVELLETDSPKESINWADSNFSATYDLYQRAKDRRRQELLEMEKEMRDNQESQAQVAANTQLRRQKLLEDVAEEQEKLEDEIMQLQSKKEKDKQRLLVALSCLEDHSAKLIDELIAVNEKSKNTEALLELMERDRKETEELFTLKQEELEQLRKREVINAMKEMLEAEEKQRQYEADKLQMAKKMKENPLDDDERIQCILTGREQDQMALINDLLQEEKYQKQAFEVLQLQKDQKHLELTHHIRQIQKELTKLTTAEFKRKDLKLNFELNVLAERRTVLAELLCNLLTQRDRREEELKKRIQEMEAQRMQEINDFWLIQYQRLMDKIPQRIEELEQTLDPSIVAILSDANAQEFITLFAVKQVTLHVLLTMTEKDLQKLGVTNESIRDNILQGVNNYLSLKQKNIEEEGIELLPSAPSPDREENPSAPPLSPTTEIKIWCNIECVICMDKESQAVFLPCGHVCCCWNCGETLMLCPMCRADIANKYILQLS